LVNRVGNGGGDEDRKVGGDGPWLELESFGRPGAVLLVDLIVHPVPDERLLLTGQSRQDWLLRHMCNRSVVGAPVWHDMDWSPKGLRLLVGSALGKSVSILTHAIRD
jgi:hypothetical protein